jgi:peptide deformylase
LIRDIVKFGDPRLTADNEAVERFDEGLARLVADLVETCHAAPGLGLAAPQVGVNLRVAVLDLSIGKDPQQVLVLVNPAVVSVEGEVREEEGCLSIPGLSEAVARPARVVIEAADARGRVRRIPAEGLLARALCHETDHLDSKLFVERLRGLKREMVMRRLRRRAGALRS